MKVYIYHNRTKQVACVIIGDNYSDIENEINYQNYETGIFSVTDNPEGLSFMYDTDYIDVTGSYE
jgi:hypothetical protein